MCYRFRVYWFTDSNLLANKGFEVHGVDINKKAVELINNGKVHIYEPDLDKMVKNAVDSGILKSSVLPEKADVFIITVPTPLKKIISLI